MAYTIINKDTGVTNIFAMPQLADFQAITDGSSGKNCVLSGLTVTGSGLATVNVAKGSVITNYVHKAVAANATLGGFSSPDVQYDNFNVVVVNSSGSLAVRQGTPAATPLWPTLTANDVPIALVFIQADSDLGATAIASGHVIDKRVMRENGPIAIYRNSAVETTNTTISAVHILDKTNSGVSIANGLLLAGRKLRVTIGGNILLNSGSPTLDLVISFGGTTMYDTPVSGTATADTDRLAFTVEYTVSSVGTSDQRLNGNAKFSIVGAKTGPTTGSGPAWGADSFVWPLYGSAAVNADTANRTLTTTLTMSVSNASNEIVVTNALVELI